MCAPATRAFRRAWLSSRCETDTFRLWTLVWTDCLFAASSSSSSSGPRAPSSDASEYDLDSLLSWDRTRAADRARETRLLRDQILERERESQRERRNLMRLGGESRELSDILAGMMARTSLSGASGGFDDEASGPVLDENGVAKKLAMTLRCFSFAVVGKEHLQMGDKVILPPEALYHVQKIRLPFPLLFRIENASSPAAAAAASSSSSSRAASAADRTPPADCRYIGVLEFSAPEEHIYMPTWMMEDLRLSEGGTVRIHSEVGVPQGAWVHLVPHSIAFSALLRELGPKYFLEMALRHYSVLTKGQRILIAHGGANYSLDVVDAKPANTISLLGNLDLEVEFGVALDAPKEAREADGSVTFRSRVSGGHALPAADDPEEDEDFKRAVAMSLAESGMANEARDDLSHAAATAAVAAAASPVNAPSPVGDDEGWAVAGSAPTSPSAGVAAALHARFGGNRLGGPPGESTQVTPSGPPAFLTESKEDLEAAESDTDAEESDEEDGAAEAPTEIPDNHTLCPSCLKPISNASFVIHSARCARAFVKCAVCSRMVKKGDVDSHAARHVTVPCPDCAQQMEQKRIRRHRRKECVYRPVSCQWCAQPTPLITLPSHESACGSITSECSLCHQDITRRDMPSHPNSEGCRLQCGKCDEVVASKDIVVHTRDRCSGRMIACPHCKLSFAHRDTARHQDYCGSRTESCEKCQRYIKLRDMQTHIDSNCTFPPVESKPPPSSSPRASPSFGALAPSASARMNLLSSMLDSGSEVDPGVMAALLAQSVELEDPLAAAAARRAASTTASSAQRQATAARERLARAIDAEDSSDEDAPGAARSVGRSSSRAVPAARSSSIRRSPPASAASRSSVGRAASVPRAAPAGSFICAYCQDRCASLESLQVHILTECHDAHSTAELIDPAAAAKALAGQAKQVTQEHVSVKIPVAKPINRPAAPASYSSSSSAAASSIAAAESSSSSSASSARSSSRDFDPYDLGVRRPAAHRLADSDDEDRDSSVRSAVKTAAKPKVMTASSKMLAHGTRSSSVATSSLDERLATRATARDASVSSYLTGSSSSAASSRTSLTATPLSLKQQQKELARAISTRKTDSAKPLTSAKTATAASSLSAYLDDDLLSEDASSRPRSVVPKRSSLASGVSPSFMAGLGADVPNRHASSTSSASSSSPGGDYEEWLRKNFPATAARMESQRSQTDHLAAPSSASSFSSSSSSGLSARGPSSPLATLLGSARAAPSSYTAASTITSSSYVPSSAYAPISSTTSPARPRFDRPLSGSRHSALTSPHVPLYQPPSPPTQQKSTTRAASRPAIGSGSIAETRVSSSHLASASSSRTTAGVGGVAGSRVRGTSATRATRAAPAAAVSSAHVPLFGSSLAAASSSGPAAPVRKPSTLKKKTRL